jgi:hypothetical protein
MPLVTEAMLQAAFDYFNEQGPAAAQARADLVIAEYRRKKARAAIILASSERTMMLREAEAECHPDVYDATMAEADAVKAVEWHRHQRARADAIVEAWRTQEATVRGLSRVA